MLYDRAGRLVTSTDDLGRFRAASRDGQIFGYGYDANDDVTSRSYPSGAALAADYDADNRMTALTEGGSTWRFGYDPAGRRATTQLPASTGLVEDRAYDNAGRLTRVDTHAADGTVGRYDISLDPVGNPIGANYRASSGSLAGIRAMTQGLGYDEAALAARLADLTGWQRTAFAASCAQRLAPAFRRYAEEEGLDAGPPGAVEEALDELWRALGGEPVTAEELRSLADSCIAAVPGEEKWNEWADQAEHAAAASAYAIQTWLTTDPAPAAWAARQGYHAADLTASADLDSGVIDDAVQQTLRDSEPVQRELRNQQEDLATVVGSRDGDTAVLSTLRARSSS
jgi:YD repeat-containing protein